MNVYALIPLLKVVVFACFENLETDNYASEVTLQRHGVQKSSSQCNEWASQIYRESDLCCQDIKKPHQ